MYYPQCKNCQWWQNFSHELGPEDHIDCQKRISLGNKERLPEDKNKHQKKLGDMEEV